MHQRVVLLCILLSSVAVFCAIPNREYGQIDGYGNNVAHPTWGQADVDVYIRLFDKADYPDGVGFQMAGPDRPNPRSITNQLQAGIAMRQTPRRLTDFFTFFGEFMTGDIALFRTNASEPCHIPIPQGDPFKDPEGTGTKFLSLTRFRFNMSVGSIPDDPRPPLNKASAYLDAGTVYGNLFSEMNSTRTFSNGTIFEAWNMTKIVKASDPAMAAISYLFVKEHNRLALQFAENNPDWDDDTLFYEARRWVIAFIQKISTREYTAALLGEPLPAYQGYNSSVRGSVDNFWTNTAFRYGHSEVNSMIPLIDENWDIHPYGYYPLREAFNSAPGTKAFKAGFEPFFRGMCVFPQKEVGPTWVDDVRNFALKPTGGSITLGQDLAARDIQRGRDLGFADYNTMREYFGLERKETFEEISSDPKIVETLRKIYNNDTDLIDPYVGGICEDKRPNSNLGDLFWLSYYNGIQAMRNGDRFWYENDQFTASELAEIYGTTLSAIVERNFNVTGLPLNVFFISERQLNATVSPFLYPRSEKYTHFLDLSTTYRLSWFRDNDEIQFMIQAAVTGWVGLGLEPDENTMKNADIYIGRVTTDIDGNQVTELYDRFARDVGIPTPDSEMGGKDDILWFQGSEKDGLTTIEFRRKIDTGDKWDKVLREDQMKVIFAFNPDTDEFLYHGPTRSSTARINFLEVEVVPQVTNYSNVLRIIIAVFAALGCALVVGLIITIYIFKDKFIFYTPLFCVLICFGGLFGYIYMFLLYAEQKDPVCVAQTWMIVYAFVIMFGSLFTKTWRIWRITTEAEKRRKRVKITDVTLLKIVGFMVLVASVYLAIWTGIDGPKSFVVEDPIEDDNLKLVCHSDNSFWTAIVIAVCAILLFTGVYLTWRVRHVPQELNETKTIGIAVYTVAIVSIISIPVIIALSKIPTATIILKALAVFITVTASLLILFVPKLIAPTPMINDQPVSEVMKKAKEDKKSSKEKSKTASASSSERPQKTKKGKKTSEEELQQSVTEFNSEEMVKIESKKVSNSSDSDSSSSSSSDSE